MKFLNLSLLLVLLLILPLLITCQVPIYHHQQQQQPQQHQNGPSDMIHMSEISALTLYDNKWTTSRKNKPFPQLKCIGGDAQHEGYVPKVVSCRNIGTDGTSIQWKCDASMDDQYKFGTVHVHCEGYTGPGDINVVKGSCSLDYELLFTEKGKRMKNNHNNNNVRSGSNYRQRQQNQRMNNNGGVPIYGDDYNDSSNGGGSAIWIVVIVVGVAIVIYKFSSSSSDSSTSYETPPYNPNASSSSDGFSDNFSNIYPGVVPPRRPFTATNTSCGVGSEGIGTATAFATGLGLGATGGYMAGRATSGNRSSSGYQDTHRNNRSYSYSNSSHRFGDDNSGSNYHSDKEKSGEHKTSGYGGSSSR